MVASEHCLVAWMRLVVLWPQRDCPCLWHVYMIKKLAQKNTEGVGKGGLKSEAETKNKRSARLFLLRFLAKNDFWKSSILVEADPRL